MRAKRICSGLLAGLMAAMVLCGCEKEEEEPVSLWEAIPQETPEAPAQPEETVAQEEEQEPELVPLEVPDGMYISELTGEPVSESIRDQRPIAVMIDNDARALPHYGTADADVVYEMMNSTANNRITRLMALYKDWGSIEQVGSIRSTRPTNILLCSEWDAVLCHDGGPYYNDSYFNNVYNKHFSGTFSRVKNGKDWEFTEYIVSGDLDKNFSSSGYSKEYDADKPERIDHFNFVEYGLEADLEAMSDSVLTANTITLPFQHNGSRFEYNPETKLYEYYEYDGRHEDAVTGEPLAFTNLLIQSCDFHQYDENGYLIYNCIAATQLGYYVTRGKAIPIVWTKPGEKDPTRYYTAMAEEIEMNTGKTYITLVPSDSWSDVSIY